MFLLNSLLILQFSITFLLHGVQTGPAPNGQQSEDSSFLKFRGNHTGVVFNDPLLPLGNSLWEAVYTDEVIATMVTKVSTNFAKIYLTAFENFTEKVIHEVESSNKANSNNGNPTTSIEFILQLPLNKSEDITKVLSRINETAPGTVTTLVITSTNLTSVSIPTQGLAKMGFTMNTTSCTERSTPFEPEMVDLLKKLDHVFLVTYPNLDEKFEQTGKEYDECVQIIQGINKNLTFTIITNYQGQNEASFDLFWKEGNDWAETKNTNIIFSNAFDLVEDNVGKAGWWRVEENEGKYIFTDKTKARSEERVANATVKKNPGNKIAPSKIQTAGQGKTGNSNGIAIAIGVLSTLVITSYA